MCNLFHKDTPNDYDDYLYYNETILIHYVLVVTPSMDAAAVAVADCSTGLWWCNNPGLMCDFFFTNIDAIAMICVTKSRTGNYDFRACARERGFPGSTRFGRTHTLRRVCRAITR